MSAYTLSIDPTFGGPTWVFNGSDRPEITADFLPPGGSISRYLARLAVVTTGSSTTKVVLQFASSQFESGSGGGDDLSDAFENDGVFTLEATGAGLVNFGILGADLTEVYLWSPTNVDDVLAWGNAFAVLATTPDATFTIRDVAASTAPDTPAAPTFDQETSTALRINWVAPDDGGDPIASYDLRYREQGTGPWTDVNNQTGTSYTTPSTLDSATTYEAQVRATNSVGDSAYSPSGTGTTLADLTPSAPAVADQASTVGANVNFQLPVGTGGDAPLSYGASNLPAGLSFSGSTRRISGSPTTIQTRTVTYTVTDVDGDADSVTFDFVIGAALALSDMDDTGLQVDFKALIEVSGTTRPVRRFRPWRVRLARRWRARR